MGLAPNLVAVAVLHCCCPEYDDDSDGTLFYFIWRVNIHEMYVYFGVAENKSYITPAFTNPDGVIFLGDLLDAGDTSADSDFLPSMSRFREIFLPEKDLFVYNDVGGEGVSVTDARLSRFYGSFPAKSTQHKCKFVNFYSVSINLFLIYLFKDNMSSGTNVDIQSEKSPDEINVFISHFPVATQYHTWFPIKLLQSNASLCIHGHLHRSQVIHWKNSKGSENSEASISWLQAANFIRTPREPLHFKLTDSVHYVKFSSEPTFVETLKAYGELISIGVPSCTYRSGFPHLNGIGLLQIYRNKSVTYSVLPLYNR
ncbi:unnamed protein product [Trichobilharzia regenti]|nr:unnamed protein product [Trichobilharzia regenti]